MVCGECVPCAECICNNDAIDSFCPVHKCPETPVEDLRYIQGAFYARKAMHNLDGKEADSDIKSASSVVSVECQHHFHFVGTSITESQSPVLSGDGQVAGPKAEHTERMLQTCSSFSRTGVFRISEPASAAFPRIMHVQFTGGDAALQEKHTWHFETKCPRSLLLTNEDGTRYELRPAPGTRFAWHGGRIGLFAREAEESSLSAGARPDAFYSHALIGTWHGRMSRRTFAEMSYNIPGCAQTIILTVWDRDPSLPLLESYYTYDLRLGECEREEAHTSARHTHTYPWPSSGPHLPAATGRSDVGRQAPRRAATRLAGLPRRAALAPAAQCPVSLAHRECDEEYTFEEEELVTHGTLQGALALLQMTPPPHVRLLRFQPSPRYSNRTLQVVLRGAETLIVAPQRARFIGLNITAGNASALQYVQVFRLTSARERVSSLHHLSLRVDAPCLFGTRQRVLYRRAGQLPREQVVERCLQPEGVWLNHLTGQPWSPQGNIYGIRSYEDDESPFVAALIHSTTTAHLYLTVRAHPEEMVCPAGYRGADGQFGLRRAPRISGQAPADGTRVPESYGYGGDDEDESAHGQGLDGVALADDCLGPCPTAPPFTPVAFAAATCPACQIGSFLETYVDEVTQQQVKPPVCVPCQQALANTALLLSTKPSLHGAHSISDCRQVCAPGYFSSDGFGPCEACAQGKYTESHYSTECTPCPDGRTTTGPARGHQSACFRALVGVERVFLRGKRIMVTVFWDVQPRGHAGITDMVALVQQPATVVADQRVSGRQLAYAFTSDARSTSDDIGSSLSSRPGPVPLPAWSLTFSMESGGAGQYAVVLYSNVSGVAGYSQTLGVIVAERAFSLADYLSHIPPAMPGGNVYYGLVCPPGYYSLKGGWQPCFRCPAGPPLSSCQLFVPRV